MGGGDLNLKKSWHPVTRANQEKKWLAEQRVLEEQKKTAQLQKELNEERRAMEMQKLQEDAGLIKKRSERLDWMYAGPSHMNQDLQEDYLLGKKSVSSLIETAPSISDLSAASGSLFMKNSEDGAGASMSERDMEAKIREDPLFAIKKREQEMLNRIMANPARAKKMVAPSSSSSRNNREHREIESDRSDREYGRRDSRRDGRDGDSRDSRDTRRDVYRDARDTHRDSRYTHRDNYHGNSRHRDNHHRETHHRDHSRYRRDRSHSPPVNTSTSRVRGMSKEEREAKLAEMMQAAQDTDQQRVKRIQMYKKEDELEASMSANRVKNHDNDDEDDNDNDDGFLGRVRKDAFGSAATSNLTDRVRSKRFFISKDE